MDLSWISWVRMRSEAPEWFCTTVKARGTVVEVCGRGTYSDSCSMVSGVDDLSVGWFVVVDGSVCVGSVCVGFVCCV